MTDGKHSAGEEFERLAEARRTATTAALHGVSEGLREGSNEWLGDTWNDESSLPGDSLPALGGKYLLGDRIGGGGMAEVFAARTLGAQGFARDVAIKKVKRGFSADPGFAELFAQEARLAAALNHPNIVQTFDFDRDPEGCFYLVMERIDGVDLRQLRTQGALPVHAVMHIAAEALRALDYAHEMVSEDGRPLTVIHRDLTPHNMMVSWNGTVKLVDFGIAKAVRNSCISRSDSFRGKVGYISPEQVHGLAVDGRSDLWSLGLVLHEMLTGKPLFRDKTEAATLSLLLTAPIPAPSQLVPQVPESVDRLVLSLLQRDRDKRISRAAEALALVQTTCSPAGGQRALEDALRTRFPERAPERVQRVSASRSERPYKAPTDRAIPALPTTRAARPAKLSPELSPKRTATAGVVKEDVFSSDPQPITARPIEKPELMRFAPYFFGTCFAACLGVGAAMLSRPNRGDSGASQELVEDFQDEARSPSTPSASNVERAEPKGTAIVSSSPSDSTEAGAAADPPDELREGTEPEETISEDEQPRPAKAAITFRVTPWAIVEVDGVSYGQTPVTLSLSAGRHKVTLENQGLGKREVFRLSVRGKDREITRDWKRPPGITLTEK